MPSRIVAARMTAVAASAEHVCRSDAAIVHDDDREA